jgi:ERCC4-type nuclease
VNSDTSVAVSPHGFGDADLVLTITADVHERASGIPSLLVDLGAFVTVRALRQGDYALSADTIVERKTVADLHLSICAGRFWQQMRTVRAGVRPYLLIEGHSLFVPGLHPEAVRGICLAVLDLGVPIIRTEDADDTARWLYRLASRRSDGTVRARPPYAQRPASPAVSPVEEALAAAAGVSSATARTVLAKFRSLRRLSDATVEDLMSLPGVGAHRAAAIVALMHNEWQSASPTSHSAQRNGRRRAT